MSADIDKDIPGREQKLERVPYVRFIASAPHLPLDTIMQIDSNHPSISWRARSPGLTCRRSDPCHRVRQANFAREARSKAQYSRTKIGCLSHLAGPITYSHPWELRNSVAPQSLVLLAQVLRAKSESVEGPARRRTSEICSKAAVAEKVRAAERDPCRYGTPNLHFYTTSQNCLAQRGTSPTACRHPASASCE